jgi:D,D-heptose 1,7-bisphosphate phosphatase
VYVFNKSFIGNIPDGPCDLGKDVLPEAVENGVKIYGYHTDEYIMDMGTPERLNKVRDDYDNGRIFRNAVFLDRDGVINEKEGMFVYKPSQMKLMDGSADAIKSFRDNGFLTVVITNQPVIARNLCTEEELEKIHKKMRSLLKKHGADVDAIYYCPHHPDKGYPEENPKHKIECECRKPSPGMIFKACNELVIDPRRSFMVGDSTGDIKAGSDAGCKTVLVMTGNAGSDKKYDIRPDYVCKNLLDASKIIIKTHKPKMRI